MIAEIHNGIVILNTEKDDKLNWDDEPFVDTVWHQWIARRQEWDPSKFSNCYWMILE